jgi:hypothetical protein
MDEINRWITPVSFLSLAQRNSKWNANLLAYTELEVSDCYIYIHEECIQIACPCVFAHFRCEPFGGESNSSGFGFQPMDSFSFAPAIPDAINAIVVVSRGYAALAVASCILIKQNICETIISTVEIQRNHHRSEFHHGAQQSLLHQVREQH